MAKFNVNFSDSTHEALLDMSRRLDQPMAEIIRQALSIYGWLIREASIGGRLLIQRGDRAPSELVIPYLQALKVPVELPPPPGEPLGRNPAGVRPPRGRRSMEAARGHARPLPT